MGDGGYAIIPDAEGTGGARPYSSDNFDDAHHAFVFVIDCMTMVDEPTDDNRVGERDDDLEQARPLVSGRRHRKSVAQTIIVPRDAAHFRH